MSTRADKYALDRRGCRHEWTVRQNTTGLLCQCRRCLATNSTGAGVGEVMLLGNERRRLAKPLPYVEGQREGRPGQGPQVRGDEPDADLALLVSDGLSFRELVVRWVAAGYPFDAASLLRRLRVLGYQLIEGVIRRRA